jgi:2-dehydropantoate 2-reductase
MTPIRNGTDRRGSSTGLGVEADLVYDRCSMSGTEVREEERTPESGARQDPRPSVCVIGAGAIGSLIAAHLARIASVSILVRRAEHARSLQERGLRVSGLAEFTSAIQVATTSPTELPPFEIAFVATKATEVEHVARALHGRCPEALMVTIQNGLGVEERLRRHGPWPIVAGTTLMGGVRHDDTHVEYELAAPTWLGPYGSVPFATVARVAGLLERAGLMAVAFPDLGPARWSKLVFNAAVGSIAALTDLPHSPPFADEQGLGGLVRAVIDEGVRVATAEGIELLEDPWELNVRAARDGYAHVPSILLDVRARKPTEVDFNVGAIVRCAERHGIDAPLSEALYHLLKAKESAYA